MNPLAALLSLALHLSLLLTLPHEEEKQPKKSPPPVDLIAGDVELLPKEETTLNPDAMHVACPETYEGIGIKRRWGGLVTEVAQGWPAHRAGIQPGDLIEPWLFYPVDGFMEFEVVRNGKRVKMKLRTEKICFRDGPF